jgi:hypothetical protein
MGNEGILFESAFPAKAVISRELKKSEKWNHGLPSCERVNKGYRETSLDWKKFYEFLIKDLLDGSEVVVNRRYLHMSMEMTKAAEILESSTKLVEDKLNRYTEMADRTVEKMKNIAKQLADHENHLSEAMQRLSKTLGDPAMTTALENAKQLSDALSLLEQMEPGGALERVVKALSASGKACEPTSPHMNP